MDAGNEREAQNGAAGSARSGTPETEETGWGAPAGSIKDPEPVRRRPVLRAPGPSRLPGSGWDQDPADWAPSGPEDDEAGGASDLTGTNGLFAGAAGGQESEPLHPPADSRAGGSRRAGPDHTDILPFDAEGEEGSYGRDPAYAPVDDYEESGVSEPVGAPEVWGAHSYEVGAGYPLDGYHGGRPGSHMRRPIFPTDPEFQPYATAPRRHRGAIAAALAALVLIGGGIAAAVILRGSPPAKVATSNSPTSLPANRSAHEGATATTTVPATTAPAATTAPSATAAGTTPPPATAPTTLAPASTTLGLSSWVAQELHLILQIKGDLTSLNRDMHPQPDFSLLTVDATNLGQDLQAASNSPTPADTTVAQMWTQLLRDMGTSNNDLNSAIRTHDPNLAQDLSAAVTTTDNDYNNLSHTLNEHVRHADSPGAQGHSGGNS